MKKQKKFNGLFYLVAPPVLVMAILSIWLAAAAIVENLRLARAADQIIAAVARSREMRIPVNADSVRAQGELVKRLASFDGLEMVIIPPEGARKDSEYGFATPWGDSVRVFVYASAQAVRFEVPLARSSCRKMLSLYAPDAGSMGLQRVDIRDQLPSALWRLVYEQPRGGGGSLDPSAVEAGCGNAPSTVVSLTFSLR